MHACQPCLPGHQQFYRAGRGFSALPGQAESRNGPGVVAPLAIPFQRLWGWSSRSLDALLGEQKFPNFFLQCFRCSSLSKEFRPRPKTQSSWEALVEILLGRLPDRLEVSLQNLQLICFARNKPLKWFQFSSELLVQELSWSRCLPYAERERRQEEEATLQTRMSSNPVSREQADL